MAVYFDGEYGGCRVDGCGSYFQSQYPVCLWPLRGLAFLVSLRPLRGCLTAMDGGNADCAGAHNRPCTQSVELIPGHVRIKP